MTTIAARPRWLTIGLVVLFIAQVALVVQGLNQASHGMSTRPLWMVATSGVTSLSLIVGMLLAPRYPRATWALLAVAAVGLITTVSFRQLG